MGWEQKWKGEDDYETTKTKWHWKQENGGVWNEEKSDIELMEKLNKGRKDNIESRRSALNTPVGAIFLSEIIAETC